MCGGDDEWLAWLDLKFAGISGTGGALTFRWGVLLLDDSVRLNALAID